MPNFASLDEDCAANLALPVRTIGTRETTSDRTSPGLLVGALDVRRRLDAELVRRGLATNRTQATAAIEAKTVLVGGAVAEKAARLVGPGDAIVVSGGPSRFVSRGGVKLDAALERFAIDVSGKTVLDAGASTGGFTDCLLQRGATSVLAVDVGIGQLHERIRADPRVEVHERCNVRTDALAQILGGRTVPLIVADLSFISLNTVAPSLVGALAPSGGTMVLLIKPQFEAGRTEVSKGRGVIRDPLTWGRALRSVVTAYAELGAAMMDVMTSPITGADGNVEFLASFRTGSKHGTDGESAAAMRIDDVIRGAGEQASIRAVVKSNASEETDDDA